MILGGVVQLQVLFSSSPGRRQLLLSTCVEAAKPGGRPVQELRSAADSTPAPKSSTPPTPSAAATTAATTTRCQCCQTVFVTDETAK